MSLNQSNLTILLIHLEFMKWEQARSWSYAAQLGIEEGLLANGIEFFTIPAMQEFSTTDSKSWLAHCKDLCNDRHFDQVWVELVHSNIDDIFLQWLTNVAPIRLGLIAESLRYQSEVYSFAPILSERYALVTKRLKYMTHALVADEKDAEELNLNGPVKAMWWPVAVPKRYVHDITSPPRINCATFFGAIYGDRSKWLELDSLKNILIRMVSPVASSSYPAIFDEINFSVTYALKKGMGNSRLLEDYLAVLRYIRQEIFKLFIDDFRIGCAVVNLPHFVQTYPGRVAEAMAAGRPVISWEIPDRPRTKSLYEDGKEILLFPKDNPDILSAHIRQIQNNPEFGKWIADNARRKLLCFHTVEKRVKQILHWLETGKEISYHIFKGAEDVKKYSCDKIGPVQEIEIEQLLKNFYSHFKTFSCFNKIYYHAILLCKKLSLMKKRLTQN